MANVSNSRRKSACTCEVVGAVTFKYPGTLVEAWCQTCNGLLASTSTVHPRAKVKMARSYQPAPSLERFAVAVLREVQIALRKGWAE